jgi:hypothetical protein
MYARMMVVSLVVVSGCVEHCKVACPRQLTLALLDADGKPLTPASVTDTALGVTHACGDGKTACADNQLTFDPGADAATVLVTAVTGQQFTGQLVPAWQDSGAAETGECHCTTISATLSLTLR